jgi:hypothetical protein
MSQRISATTFRGSLQKRGNLGLAAWWWALLTNDRQRTAFVVVVTIVGMAGTGLWNFYSHFAARPQQTGTATVINQSVTSHGQRTTDTPADIAVTITPSAN